MRRNSRIPGYDAFMNANENELTSHVNEWVAYSNEKMEASAKTFQELVKALKSKSIPLEKAFITKIRKDCAMIL